MVFLVLYLDNIFGSWKQYQNIVRSKGMVVQTIRYEGLGRINILYSWDQSNKGSQDKNILLIPNFIYRKKSLLVLSMQNSKKGFLPFQHGVTLSKEMSPQTSKEIEEMKAVLYASAVGSLMYAMHEIRNLFCQGHSQQISK